MERMQLHILDTLRRHVQEFVMERMQWHNLDTLWRHVWNVDGTQTERGRSVDSPQKAQRDQFCFVRESDGNGSTGGLSSVTDSDLYVNPIQMDLEGAGPY